MPKTMRLLTWLSPEESGEVSSLNVTHGTGQCFLAPVSIQLSSDGPLSAIRGNDRDRNHVHVLACLIEYTRGKITRWISIKHLEYSKDKDRPDWGSIERIEQVYSWSHK